MHKGSCTTKIIIRISELHFLLPTALLLTVAVLKVQPFNMLRDNSFYKLLLH